MGRWPARTTGRRASSRTLATAIVVLSLGFPVARAAADGSADLAAACGPAPDDPPVRIAAVDGTGDVRLTDGRTLRLAGLDFRRPSDAPQDSAPDMRDALAAWAGAGPVTVRTFADAPDRWGRLPALLFRPDAPEPSAATLLLDAGLARARPEPAVHPCFAAFLEAEDRARAAKRGLWADPRSGVLGAGDADALARASGGFAIVEGILGVHAARGGTLYLTLGRDRWGFAAVLTRRDAARLAKAGLDVADYAGTPVRLRGDLDDRFGARMRLTDPDQFQSLEPGALDPEPATPR